LTPAWASFPELRTGTTQSWRLSVGEIINGPGSRTTTFPRTILCVPSQPPWFQTGDLFKAVAPKGKYAWEDPGRVEVRSSGSFDIKTKDRKKTGSHRYCGLFQRNDGYEYNLKKWEPNSSPWPWVCVESSR
jgi:hypothetical protein